MIVHGDAANVSVAVDTGEALTICGRESNNGSELIGLATAAGARKWHVNIFEPAGANPGGLNFAESGVADGRMFLAYGGNVGIGTYAPVSLLHINGAPGQSTELRLTSQPAATTKAATVCSMVLQADGGKESSIVSSETQMTVLTSHDFVAVSGASGGGLCVNTPTGVMGVLNWRNGSVQIDGSLTATTKNFSIDHPLRAGERLLHGSLEGPEAGVYYRGEGVLEGGTATVRLPDYFEALTRPEDRTVHLTAKGCEPFLLSYEDVIDGRFIVHGTKPGGRFSWEVRAVRADTPRLAVEPGRAGERAAP
jgi:hypothetical protein